MILNQLTTSKMINTLKPSLPVIFALPLPSGNTISHFLLVKNVLFLHLKIYQEQSDSVLAFFLLYNLQYGVSILALL